MDLLDLLDDDNVYDLGARGSVRFAPTPSTDAGEQPAKAA